MSQVASLRMVHVSMAVAVAALVLAAFPAFGGVLLGNGQPDPGHNGNAMQAWLRADSGVTTYEGVISDWQDRSNNDNDATQATPADQPDHVRGTFAGRQAADFRGDDGPHLQFGTGFDSAFDGSFTMFILLAPLDGHPSGDRVAFGLVSADGQDRMVLGLDPGGPQLNFLYKVDGTSADCMINPMPFPNGAQSKHTLISYVNNAGGTHYAYVDGNPAPAATVSGGGVNNANFVSGASTAFIGSANDGAGATWPSDTGTFDGLIAEFILYDGALSTAEREAVEDYMLSYPPPILSGGSPDPSFDNNAMQVWLRADSGVTTAGGSVSDWQDRSNNDNDAVQATPGDRPTHASTSLPNSEGRGRVVNFAGGGVHLQFPTGFDTAFDGDFTMFMLFAPDDGVPSVDRVAFGLVSEDQDDRMVLGLDPSGGTSLNYLYKVNTDSIDCKIAPLPFPDGPPSEFTLVSYVNTAGDWHYAYTNGGPVAAASVDGSSLDNSGFDSGTSTAFIGSANNGSGGVWPSVNTSFDGGIVEFILYDIALSDGDREQVEDYLLNGPPPLGTMVIVH